MQDLEKELEMLREVAHEDLKIEEVYAQELTTHLASKKITIYIAGKMTGLANYKEKFDKAEKLLTSMGHIVMNPATLPHNWPVQAYMPVCLAMLSTCDAIYLLNNWGDSPGAQLELAYARYQGKEILYEVEEEK